MTSTKTTHGFLVVKRFEVLYREFVDKRKLNLPIYALPVFGTGPEEVSVRYRGLDREAISSNKKGTLAEIRLHELEQAGATAPFDDLLASLDDGSDVLRWAEEEFPGVYELVWTRIAGSDADPPAGLKSLGFEFTYFVSDHFSAICDCMCFPRWHGTDQEGSLFRPWFDLLNPSGLFAEPSVAADFLAYYLSFDWTETGDYEIAEVWS